MFGAQTFPGPPSKKAPAPFLPSTGGAPGAFQSRSEWQKKHPMTFSARYLPRSILAGVFSKLRSVKGRDAGPRNGRHPIEKVIPAAIRSTMATTPKTRSLRLRSLIRSKSFPDAPGCLPERGCARGVFQDRMPRVECLRCGGCRDNLHETVVVHSERNLRELPGLSPLNLAALAVEQPLHQLIPY